MQVDAALERYGPPATTILPEWIRVGPRAINAAVSELLLIDEDDLARCWRWRDDPVGAVGEVAKHVHDGDSVGAAAE